MSFAHTLRVRACVRVRAPIPYELNSDWPWFQISFSWKLYEISFPKSSLNARGGFTQYYIISTQTKRRTIILTMKMLIIVIVIFENTDATLRNEICQGFCQKAENDWKIMWSHTDTSSGCFINWQSFSRQKQLLPKSRIWIPSNSYRCTLWWNTNKLPDAEPNVSGHTTRRVKLTCRTL